MTGEVVIWWWEGIAPLSRETLYKSDSRLLALTRPM